MTIDNAEHQGQNEWENENKNLKRDVFYRGARLLGGLIKNKDVFFDYTPEAMLGCLNNYEKLIAGGKYNEAREFESDNNLPFEWLNLVISKEARESKSGLVKRLIDEFKERGYSGAWLKSFEK